MTCENLISIIIPVYNVEDYLEECLNSILQQDYDNYEVILVNDGSTDNSLNIASEFDKKYSFVSLINQSNKGVGAARNMGIQYAKGEYLYFLDSDDFLANDFFTIVSKELLLEPDILLFGFNRVNNAGKYLNSQTPPNIKLTNINIDKSKIARVFRSGVGHAVWDKLIRKELLIENKLLFDNKKRGEDITFIFNLLKVSGSFLAIANNLINYRILLADPSKFDFNLVDNHLENFNKIFSYFNHHRKDNIISSYLINIFSVWFFMVIPMHLAKTKKITLIEKKQEFKKLVNNSNIIEFMEKNGEFFNLFQKMMKFILIHKLDSIYFLFGKSITLVRKLKYS